jgi:hypothetical protein
VPLLATTGWDALSPLVVGGAETVSRESATREHAAATPAAIDAAKHPNRTNRGDIEPVVRGIPRAGSIDGRQR